MPGYCEVDGVNMEGLAGLAAGLGAFGADRVSQMTQAYELASALAQAAKADDGMRVFGHVGGPLAAAASLRHNCLELAQADAKLADHGVRVRAGLHCAPDALAAIGASEGNGAV